MKGSPGEHLGGSGELAVREVADDRRILGWDSRQTV